MQHVNGSRIIKALGFGVLPVRRRSNVRTPHGFSGELCSYNAWMKLLARARKKKSETGLVSILRVDGNQFTISLLIFTNPAS